MTMHFFGGQNTMNFGPISDYFLPLSMVPTKLSGMSYRRANRENEKETELSTSLWNEETDRYTINYMDTQKTPPRHRSPMAHRILTTAHDLFYRNGIRATGVDRVIAESGVAKKTFYRHYPAKDDLVLTFLEYRHQNWMAWFIDALERHGSTTRAITPALSEWFHSEAFRGCAFINTVAEIGASLPAAVDISKNHKQDMAAAIRKLLPSSSRTANADARALALAVDGAIVGAQFGEPVDEILKSLSRLIAGIEAITGTPKVKGLLK
ncbi:TetR/AcrR family transcriptional regulator [Undibacterium terreum]|nr:TetR/AcrR family transcriptional regulator [Undibacterium terreum]